MAKSSRSTSKKVNHQKLKSKVFAPVETARLERLSSKLLELAAQPRPPKPVEDVNMDAEEEAKAEADVPATEEAQASAMEIDSSEKVKPAGKGRIEKKRRTRSKSAIVFPNRWKNGKRIHASKK